MQVFKQTDRVTYLDERGIIDNILPDGVIARSALFITGKKDSVRGNHFHREDEHYWFVLNGTVRYEYKEWDEVETKFVILEMGDMVYTPKGELHRYIFESDGEAVVLAIKGRDQEHYEEDTVRETF